MSSNTFIMFNKKGIYTVPDDVLKSLNFKRYRRVKSPSAGAPHGEKKLRHTLWKVKVNFKQETRGTAQRGDTLPQLGNNKGNF